MEKDVASADLALVAELSDCMGEKLKIYRSHVAMVFTDLFSEVCRNLELKNMTELVVFCIIWHFKVKMNWQI